MRFSLRQLEIFVAVGRDQSVSQAAQALSLSQSATSMALAELERQFDTRLFDRHGKRLQLNERGRQVLPRAMEVLERAQAVEALLANEKVHGPLHIGASLTIGNYLATLLIGEFIRRHPGSRVHLEVHNTATIIERVAHFALDFGLIEGECRHPDLETTPWVNDELVVFAAPDHPLARQQVVTVDDVLSAAWILREPGSGTRQTFDAAFRPVRAALHILLELEHTEAIKRAVESGMGIGCISRLALKDAFRRGDLVPLEIAGLDLRRQFLFVLHRQKFRTQSMERFLALCRQVARNVRRSDEIVLQRRAHPPLLEDQE